VSARARKKEAGMKMDFLTPTLTPALFSAPLTAESCNWMKDLLIIKSGYLNSNFDLIGYREADNLSRPGPGADRSCNKLYDSFL
jgi:hypothetical protein